MRTLLLPAFLFTVSCGSSTDQAAAPTGRKIDPPLSEILSQYPQYKTNGIQREELTVALDHFIDSILNKGYFDDFPVELRSVEKSVANNKAIFHFKFDEVAYGSTFPSEWIKYDLYGRMDDSIARTLSEGKKYYVFARKYSRVFADNPQRSKQSPLTHLSMAGKDYNFELGGFDVEVIDSVKAVLDTNN